MFYSPSTRGFYDAEMHGADIPNDCVPVTEQEWAALLQAQTAGATITPGPDGRPVAVAFSPTLQQQLDALEDAVQKHLDAQARALGYDSIFTAVTYADEPAVERFQNEGRALRAWRSQVWAHCYTYRAAAQSGAGTVPTAQALIAALPVFSI